MTEFNQLYQSLLESFPLIDNIVDIESIKLCGGYEKAFFAVLSESETVRVDWTGRKVRIPIGYSFKIGPDGVGVAIGPCDSTQTDKTGRLHSVPKGYFLKIGGNGKGIVVPQGESTRETKEGQIQLIKKPIQK